MAAKVNFSPPVNPNRSASGFAASRGQLAEDLPHQGRGGLWFEGGLLLYLGGDVVPVAADLVASALLAHQPGEQAAGAPSGPSGQRAPLGVELIQLEHDLGLQLVAEVAPRHAEAWRVFHRERGGRLFSGVLITRENARVPHCAV